MKVIIVFGLPGSGKSFFSIRLAKLLDAKNISSDKVRKKLFSTTTYSDNEKQQVYQVMLKELSDALHDKENVVLDATFYKENIRRVFIDKAESFNAITYFIEIVTDTALIKKRLAKKRKESEADFGVYEKIKKQFEPFEKTHLTLKSEDNNIEKMLSEAINYIR